MIKINDFMYQRTMQAWELKKVMLTTLQAQFKKFTGKMDVKEYHFNHAHLPSLKKALEIADKYKGPKILVSGGDSVNLDVFSRFYKNTPESVDAEYEIETLVSYLKLASQVYDRIVFLTTNHENRLRKIVSHYVGDKKVAQAIIKQMKTLDDIFQGNKLDKIVYTNSNVFKVGDVFVTHFENNSNVPGTVGEKVMRGLNNLYGHDWKLAIQCHTHSMSKNTYQRQTVIESGTFQVSPDYWVGNGRICGERKSAGIGYATCNLVNGEVDINSANYVITSWRELL